jgi:hypothetical protein
MSQWHLRIQKASSVRRQISARIFPAILCTTRYNSVDISLIIDETSLIVVTGIERKFIWIEFGTHVIFLQSHRIII